MQNTNITTNTDITGDFASKIDKKDGKIEFQSNDWMCEKCNSHNFATRGICFKCEADRPKDTMCLNDWVCKYCHKVNFGPLAAYLRKKEYLNDVERFSKEKTKIKTVHAWCKYCNEMQYVDVQ